MLRASFRVRANGEAMPAGIAVVLRDISAERAAQRAKDSFIASTSQELRTPITSIIGYTDLLESESVGPLEESQRKFLQRIRGSAESVGAQLNSLVALMEVDNRQLEVRAEAMDLKPAIHEAAEGMQARITQKHQTLEMHIEQALPLILADPDAIHHVLTSLLQNAHRASPDASHVVLRAGKVEDGERMFVAVAITDQGGGIAPEDGKKVFNRFYRSDNPTVQGLGDPEIDLPIVKVLVEAHGGRIWLDSVPGAGSTFTALLPVQQ
jgi:signal transduction histidine kinase